MRKLLASLAVVGVMLAGVAGPASAAKPDKAERLCEKSGGLFIRVDGIVYACVLPGGSTELLTVGSVVTGVPKSDKAGVHCVASGGIYLRVDNLVYACVLPNSTLEDALNALPDVSLPPLSIL